MTGKCLHHLRTRAGLTMKQISQQVGLSTSRLYEIEGRDQELRLGLAGWYRLAELVGVQIDRLPR